ncbi:MAG: trypsin-like serine protease [Clostridiales bacterium]|nr:trypsin-like serine protease [Clostridiales bacterium]
MREFEDKPVQDIFEEEKRPEPFEPPSRPPLEEQTEPQRPEENESAPSAPAAPLYTGQFPVEQLSAEQPSVERTLAGQPPTEQETAVVGPADPVQSATGCAPVNPPAGPVCAYPPPYGYQNQTQPYGAPGYGPEQPYYGAQPPYPPQQGTYGEGASYTPGGGFATAQPYQINETEPPIRINKVEPEQSEPVPNKGLRVFCMALAAVLALSAVAAVGYFAGRSGGRETGGVHQAVDLASKPEGTVSDPAHQNASYVFGAVKPSIVGIEVYSKQDGQSRAQASGVIYSSDGYIVTNDHIYAEIPDPQFLVLLADGSEQEASYVAGDSRSDLAVLKIDGSGLPAATFGNSDELEVGESVIAIGNPGGQQLAFTATGGVVSAVNRRIANASNYSMKFIQTDTAINPGSSGGALVNMYGQVVGITSWKYVGESYERIGFAVPTTIMKPVVDSLIENQYVVGRARLGITYQTIDSVSAKLYDLPRGLQIASVSNDSDLSGKVQKGDIITHINDTPITDGSEVLEVLENAKPGDTVKLTLYNSGKQQVSVSAVLLEDRGSSSFTLKSSSGDSSAPSFGSDFDFPFGE